MNTTRLAALAMTASLLSGCGLWSWLTGKPAPPAPVAGPIFAATVTFTPATATTFPTWTYTFTGTDVTDPTGLAGFSSVRIVSQGDLSKATVKDVADLPMVGAPGFWVSGTCPGVTIRTPSDIIVSCPGSQWSSLTVTVNGDYADSKVDIIFGGTASGTAERVNSVRGPR